MLFTDLIGINSVFQPVFVLGSPAQLIMAVPNPLSAASRCGDGNLGVPVLLSCGNSKGRGCEESGASLRVMDLLLCCQGTDLLRPQESGTWI